MGIYQSMNLLTNTCSLGLGQGQGSEDLQCSAISIHVLNSRPIWQLQFFNGEGLLLVSHIHKDCMVLLQCKTHVLNAMFSQI